MLCVLDEFTRESLAIRVDRTLKAADVIDVLSDLFILRGAPSLIRSDDGPECVAQTVRDWIAAVGARGAQVVISQHGRRARPRPIDADMYAWRHLIEKVFQKLKEFKRIAMRADKTDESFSAFIYLADAVINSR